MVSFAFVYAPVVFSVPVTAEIKGALGQAMNFRTAALGVQCVSLILVCEVILAVMDGSLSSLFSLKVLFMVLTGFILFYELRVLFPQMFEHLRQMGNIDKVPYNDPARQAFRSLHKRSSELFLLNMIFGALSLIRDLKKATVQ